jgi:hypothetical protein
VVSDLSVLRSRCDRLYRKAVSTSVAFLTVLQTYHDERDEEVEASAMVVSASSAGRGTTQIVAQGTHRLDALKIARDLLDVYAASDADLILAGTATPTDAEIHAEMMFRLQPSQQAISNFSTVRDEPENVQLLTS